MHAHIFSDKCIPIEIETNITVIFRARLTKVIVRQSNRILCLVIENFKTDNIELFENA